MAADDSTMNSHKRAPIEPTSSSTKRPRRASAQATAARLTAIAGSFVVVTFLVLSASRAAFTATTANSGNSVTAASIALTDNDAAAAMFAVTGLSPATNVDRCIEVTYTGTSADPSMINLYMAAAPGGTLGQYLNLTIEIGVDDGDAFSACTNFVATGAALFTGTIDSFRAAHTNFANGLDTWDPAGSPETMKFRFRVSVQDNNLAQGLTSTFAMTWEIQS
jgi:hypothetical protein